MRLGQRVRRTTRRSQEALEQLSHISAEAFTGHRIVKAFGAEAHEAARFAAASRSPLPHQHEGHRGVSMLPPLMELLGGIAMAGALWYGSQQIADGRLTPGDVPRVHLRRVHDVQAGQEAEPRQRQPAAGDRRAERIFEMLDTHTEVHRAAGRAAARAVPRAASSSATSSFGYDDGAGEAGAAERVVQRRAPARWSRIVGRSGAGKTTLVNLLPRFYDVTGGAILIDGVDIRDVTLASLRQQIGIVTQETVLFDDTDRATTSPTGRPGASPEAIEAAARAAHAHEFIAALPRGYETLIGERGQRLSGGQRQRLAIARALLKNAPILVLDEATSALDAESELLVQEALANLMLNRTSFVIAHRLSTIRRADAIIVLERGRSSRSAGTTSCSRGRTAPTRRSISCSCSKRTRRRAARCRRSSCDRSSR